MVAVMMGSGLQLGIINKDVKSSVKIPNSDVVKGRESPQKGKNKKDVRVR